MADDDGAIIEKLDILIRLVATGLVQGKSQRDQIELLSKANLPPREIADLIGTTSNTVSVALTGLRKTKKKSKRKP